MNIYTKPLDRQDTFENVRIINPDGAGVVMFVCDHASNFIPKEYNQLGISDEALADHIGWDIGAAALTAKLSALLNAPAVLASYSRLLIDCNRDLRAGDLIPEVSDQIIIPGNQAISNEERAKRIEHFYEPFHQAVSRTLEKAKNSVRCVIAIHSFTPRMNMSDRPWHLGILYDDPALPLPNALALQCRHYPDMVVGMNEPYAPKDGIYYTMSRHARSRDLHHAMLEIRNDCLTDEAKIEAWSQKLSHIITAAMNTLLTVS